MISFNLRKLDRAIHHKWLRPLAKLKREDIQRVQIELEDIKRVARRGKQYSVPSELIFAPTHVTQRLPQATILQTRWSKSPDSGSSLGYRDDYVASEMPIELSP
jgi:hypothetical protein